MRHVVVILLILLVVLVLPAAAQDPEAGEIIGVELLDDYPAVKFWFNANTGHYPLAEALNEKCNEYITTDANQHEVRDDIYVGRIGVCAQFTVVASFIPNISYILENIIIKNNFVVIRYTATYTERLRAKETITYPGMVLFQLDDDQLQEIWHYFDWCDITPESC